jgi:hypothetical protein
MPPARDGAVALTPKAGGARWRLAGASPEKAARGYSAPFSMQIGLGSRGGHRGAYQGLVDGGGAAERAPRRPWRAAYGPRVDRGATGSRRREKQEGAGPHHADKPRAKMMASTKRRRGRSTPRLEVEDDGGAPAAAQSATARARGVLERERVWKRCAQGLGFGSYKLVRGRERRPGGEKWPSMAMKPAVSRWRSRGREEE